MGITEVPEKLATNETALERLTFQHISFLLFYGHKFESNTVNPVIKSLILEWMDLTGCDDVLVDTCYQWREFYHCVILGGKKSNGISDFKRGGKTKQNNPQANHTQNLQVAGVFVVGEKISL